MLKFANKFEGSLMWIENVWRMHVFDVILTVHLQDSGMIWCWQNVYETVMFHECPRGLTESWDQDYNFIQFRDLWGKITKVFNLMNKLTWALGYFRMQESFLNPPDYVLNSFIWIWIARSKKFQFENRKIRQCARPLNIGP